MIRENMYIERDHSNNLWLNLGEVVAQGVSAEEYLARYAEDCHEWARGYVIKMSPIFLKHDRLVDYLRQLLNSYFSLKPIGRIVGQAFVMRLDSVQSYREPDIQVILRSNPGQLTDTAMIGPADICIEVVSLESSARDYGVKFTEYEAGGVQEYWIIDPQRQESRFHRRIHNRYRLVAPDKDTYTTPVLPGLRLHIPTLWQAELPDILDVVDAVKEMLADQ